MPGMGADRNRRNMAAAPLDPASPSSVLDPGMSVHASAQLERSTIAPFPLVSADRLLVHCWVADRAGEFRDLPQVATSERVVRLRSSARRSSAWS